MKLKKNVISMAMATLCITATSVHAAIINMDISGVFTQLDPNNYFFQNKAQPYYYDTTWGYGLRTQISGTMSYDTTTGKGSGTINGFMTKNGTASLENAKFKSAGGDLLIGNMDYLIGGNTISMQIVLDASGLFSALSDGFAINDSIDQSWCIANASCATPGSNDAVSFPSTYTPTTTAPISPVPIATSTFNTTGQTGAGTTLDQLSLGIDDSIGGSPMDNGIYSGFSSNIDIMALTITDIQPSTVPVPAAVWLFGSGLITLAGFSRRKFKQNKC